MARFGRADEIPKIVWSAVALATWTWGSPAAAQTPEEGRAKAAALFEEGKKLMEQDAYSDACPRLAESQKLDPQVGTMLNLALCYENLGKIASACSMWREAAASAGQKAQVDRESWAREHVQKVCPRVPVVTIDVAEQPGRDRLEITLDGAPVARAQWGKPMNLDPGEYELRATGDGLQPWSSKVSIDDRPVPAVIVPVLTLPALAAPTAAPVSVLPAPTPGGPETAAAADRRPPSRAAALATGAAGLAALGVSAGFGIAALVNERASNSDRNCVANECNAAGARDRSRAIHDAQISDVTLGVGAGAVAVGAVLWLIAPRASERASGVTVQPTVAQGAWALAVGGVWQ